MNLIFCILFLALVAVNFYAYYKAYKSYGELMHAKGKLQGFEECSKIFEEKISKFYKLKK